MALDREGGMAPNDTVLAQRAAAGDEAAFELIVRRHAGGLWRLAWSLLRDEMTAEEVVQDTLLRAHGALRSWRGDGSLRSWLGSICRNLCRDRLRRASLELVPFEAVAMVEASGSDPAAAAERAAVEHALVSLAAAEREAFVLVHVLGFTRDEAATIAGVPPSTMRSRVARAVERIAAALAEERP